MLADFCFIVQAKLLERLVLTSPRIPASLNDERAAFGPLAGPIHRSSRLAYQIGGDRSQLDIGILQRLLQSVDQARAFLS